MNWWNLLMEGRKACTLKEGGRMVLTVEPNGEALKHYSPTRFYFDYNPDGGDGFRWWLNSSTPGQGHGPRYDLTPEEFNIHIMNMIEEGFRVAIERRED